MPKLDLFCATIWEIIWHPIPSHLGWFVSKNGLAVLESTYFEFQATVNSIEDLVRTSTESTTTIIEAEQGSHKTSTEWNLNESFTRTDDSIWQGFQTLIAC